MGKTRKDVEREGKRQATFSTDNGRERDMTDILIAFIFGAFVGACLLVAVSCMIVRGENNEDMLNQ